MKLCKCGRPMNVPKPWDFRCSKCNLIYKECECQLTTEQIKRNKEYDEYSYLLSGSNQGG